MFADGFERRSWMEPASLSQVVDSKTMERLGVEGRGWGRVRLSLGDADALVEEAWRFIQETEEYLNEEGGDLRLDPTSVMARICAFRHGHRVRP